MYYFTGTLTYSSQANRNSAQSALAPLVAGLTPFAGKYPAGLNTSGTTVLTVSFQVEDDSGIDALRESMRAARAPYAVTSGHITVVKA